MKKPSVFYLYLSGSLFILLLSSAPAFAATIAVTNTNDSGAGSLRQALTEAAPRDTIIFAITGTIILTSGELVIDKDLTIKGPGPSQLSVSGNHTSRVFSVGGVTATLDGITIENGALAEENGAGIYNVGTLTVNNSHISSNQIRCFLNGCINAGLGGGIYNGGLLTLDNSVLADNGTSVECDVFQFCGGGGGGGIYNVGTLLVSNSHVISNRIENCVLYSGNCDGASGAGIWNSGSLTVDNSDISDNTSIGYGGVSRGGGGIEEAGNGNGAALVLNKSTVSENTGAGIYMYGGIPASIYNSTVSGNTGYGILAETGLLTETLIVSNSTVTNNAHGIGLSGQGANGTLTNTIVARNVQGDIFAENSVASASHNLIGAAASSGGIQNGVNGNIVGKNPVLGPLQSNGGPTMTHALMLGSPAINAGDNTLAVGPTDQRGAGFVRIAGGTVDIGSFELQIRPSPEW